MNKWRIKEETLLRNISIATSPAYPGSIFEKRGSKTPPKKVRSNLIGRLSKNLEKIYIFTVDAGIIRPGLC